MKRLLSFVFLFLLASCGDNALEREVFTTILGDGIYYLQSNERHVATHYLDREFKQAEVSVLIANCKRDNSSSSVNIYSSDGRAVATISLRCLGGSEVEVTMTTETDRGNSKNSIVTSSENSAIGIKMKLKKPNELVVSFIDAEVIVELNAKEPTFKLSFANYNSSAIFSFNTPKYNNTLQNIQVKNKPGFLN